MSNFQNISAKGVLQNLLQQDAQGVDLSKPLRVFLPQNKDDAEGFGPYGLYEVVSVHADGENGVQLTVQEAIEKEVQHG